MCLFGDEVRGVELVMIREVSDLHESASPIIRVSGLW